MSEFGPPVTMTAGAVRLAARYDRFVDRGPGARPSVRELEVAAAVAQFGGQKEAAHELGIAVATVRSHLSNLAARLGVNGPFTNMLIALGWLVIPDDGQIVHQSRSAVRRRQLVALRDEINAAIRDTDDTKWLAAL